MSIEDTRCQTCKKLPFEHAGLHNGIRVTTFTNGEYKSRIVCRMYSPTLRGKKILHTGFWKQFQTLTKKNQKKK